MRPDLSDEQNEVLRRVVRDFMARTEAETGHAPSQRDLARILGVSQQMISPFLRGTSGASFPTATRIALLAGAASVDDLLRGTGASSAPQPSKGVEAEAARLHGAELAAAAVRLMARAQGFDALFRRVWIPDDPAETDADLLWSECKAQYARWTRAKTRRAATLSEQLERYASLVDRIGTELAAQVRARIIDSAEMLEDTVRRMPVDLPIDPTLLSERSRHARQAARDVRDSDVHRIARRCFALDVEAAVSDALGDESRAFFVDRGNRVTRRDSAS
jgi:transcriptional regulator with XRE-family HTH domain